MKFKKILILLLVTSFYNATQTKPKGASSQKHLSSENSLENIKKIFPDYFKNSSAITKNEYELLKTYFEAADLKLLSPDDLIIFFIHRSLPFALHTMYLEIINMTAQKNAKKSEDENKNMDMIFSQIGDLLFEYSFQGYLENIKQYIESKKNKTTTYKSIMENTIKQIDSFIKIFLKSGLQ